MKELIIDRFEEGYVVCETPTGGFDAIPRKNLPPNAEEGSCIIVYDDGHIEVDSFPHVQKNPRRRAICGGDFFYICRSRAVSWLTSVSRKKKEIAQTPARATRV